MKRIQSTLITVLFAVLLFAQNENPYDQFGYEAPVMGVSNDILHEIPFFIITSMDTTSRFSFIAIDFRHKTINYFNWEDQLILIDSLNNYSMARWLSTDPAVQYNSPYLGMGNNPINGVDPNGAFWEELGNWFKTGYWLPDRGVDFLNNNPGFEYLGRLNVGKVDAKNLTLEVIRFRKTNDFWNPALFLADYTIMFPIDFAGGMYDFTNNWYDMEKANWQLSDKYFHSKANFQATHRGPGGEYAAKKMSNFREMTDQIRKGDTHEMCMEDHAANRYGREQAHHFKDVKRKNLNYKEALPTYRPTLLPDRY